MEAAEVLIIVLTQLYLLVMEELMEVEVADISEAEAMVELMEVEVVHIVTMHMEERMGVMVVAHRIIFLQKMVLIQ